MIKRIHVNRYNIASNRLRGTNKPALTMKAGGKNYKGDQIAFDGPGVLTYTPDKPLACGAVAYIVTTAPVKVYRGKRCIRSLK